MMELYGDWLVTERQTFTSHGNVRSISKSDLCDIIVQAWDEISMDLIKKSFLV